jgi:uncharacterized membrane protein (Fun14 family)
MEKKTEMRSILIDFFRVFDINLKRKVTMKDLFKTLLLILSASTAFLIGYYLGGERFKAKIPNFQDELEETK